MAANNKTSDQGLPIIPVIAVFFIVLFALVMGNNYLHDDMGVILKWWFMIFALGIAFYPLSYVIGKKFRDGGYVLSKGIGIALGSWIMWTLSTFKIVKFTSVSAVILLAVCAVSAYGIYISVCMSKNEKAFVELDSGKITNMLIHTDI